MLIFRIFISLPKHLVLILTYQLYICSIEYCHFFFFFTSDDSTARNSLVKILFCLCFYYTHVFFGLCTSHKKQDFSSTCYTKCTAIWEYISLSLYCLLRWTSGDLVIKKFMVLISVIELLLNQRDSVYSVMMLASLVPCSSYYTLVTILK